MPDTPLISCIMPTRNRRSFIRQAIAYFLRQDYPQKELIIVDNGEDCIIDLVPRDERIRYIRLLEPLPLGTIRNLACEQSRGDWIAHWDDDDWMASDRLTFQMSRLLASGKEACGADGALHYQLSEQSAWRYYYPRRDRPWVAGIIYRRSRWAEQPFPALNLGEDTAFIWQLPLEQLLILSDLPGYIALIHRDNTGIKNMRDPCWQFCPAEVVHQRWGEADWEFYKTLQAEEDNRSPGSSNPLTAHPCPQKVSQITPPNVSQTVNQPVNKTIHPHRSVIPLLTQRKQGTDDDLPLVSCIMPTYNRRRFVAQSILYFQQQSYPHKELIIVDDGDEPIQDLWAEDSRIHYIQLTHKQSIGTKRNLACEIAAGEIIVSWDDDDWYGIHRISSQVEPLLRGTADATGLGNSLLLTLSDRCFWHCSPALHAAIFHQGMISGTLAFWRRFWQQGVRYPDSSLAEDAMFQKRLLEEGAHLETLTNSGIFVYIRHTTNSWEFQPGEFWSPQGWQQVPSPDFMSFSDLSFYGVETQHPNLASAPNSGEKLSSPMANTSVQSILDFAKSLLPIPPLNSEI